MNGTGPELLERLRDALRELGHTYPLTGFVFAVTEPLNAVAGERSTRSVQVDAPPVDLHQMLNDVRGRAALGEHEARRALEQVLIGNERQCRHSSRIPCDFSSTILRDRE